jgi:uncharacterized protein (DUF3084 family)
MDPDMEPQLLREQFANGREKKNNESCSYCVARFVKLLNSMPCIPEQVRTLKFVEIALSLEQVWTMASIGASPMVRQIFIQMPSQANRSFILSLSPFPFQAQ